MIAARLAAALAADGLILRGGFHPDPTDEMPPLPDGGRPATVLLIGNAGDALWRAFTATAPDLAAANPLDDWLRPRIVNAAAAVGAHPVFAGDGPPYLPIQAWAARAGPVHRSPIGIMIHPDFGLWHVYRAALLFAEAVTLPAPDRRASPCARCADRPCLQVCPADAFAPERFDSAACLGHIEGVDGAPCRERGCLARRACPVGRDHAYPAAAQRFHGAAFMRGARRWLERNR
jgi:hypothetical protein